MIPISVVSLALGLTAELAPVSQWADFGSTGNNAGARNCTVAGDVACALSDAEASFVATAYDIVSLEKCFGTFNPAVPTTRAETNHTVANFLYTARQLRRLALAANATPPRVLFYWNSGVAVADCYENDLGGAILAHPEWWLRTDNGTVIYSGAQRKRPTVDYTVPAAAKWWASVPATVARMAGGAGGVMGGTFLDSATPQNRTQTSPRAPLFSRARAEAWMAAQRAALRAAKDALHAVDPTMLVFGNALTPPAGAYGGNGVGLLADGTLDGAVAEHYGGFEWADRDTGVVDLDVVRQWVAIFAATTKLDKPVLVKTWPGPEQTPIDVLGPNWPAKFVDPATGKPLNRSFTGIAAAAGHLANYSLAIYLCVASAKTSMSYGWWYDVAQGYLPGRDAPAGWYPQFAAPVGRPLADAVFTAAGQVCERSFEGLNVRVNFSDFGSATFQSRQ